MITIVVDTEVEYEEVMEYATQYMCRRRTFIECGKYKSHHCRECFNDNHIKAGIRVVSPVDSTTRD